MRTETDLRDAFATLADRAPDPVLFEQRLRRDPPRPGTRRPRPLVLVAVAACLALVAVLVPFVVLRQTTAPADLRAPGYWGFVSEVDVPAGWVVSSRGIQEGREYTLLGPSAEQSRVCDVTVWGRGGYRGTVPTGVPVRVGDRAGVYDPGTDVEPAGLMWTYADDAWARVGCTSDSAADNRAWSEQLASRVRFERQVARIPVRATKLPAGYTVGSVVTAPSNDAGLPVGGFILSSPDHGSVSVVASTTTFEPPGQGLPGVEQVTVRGYPATVREDKKSVSIAVGASYVLISGGESDTQSWAPGERDRLVSLAADLRFADDLDDPATWFDARRLP